jgi:hypothetical protein
VTQVFGSYNSYSLAESLRFIGEKSEFISINETPSREKAKSYEFKADALKYCADKGFKTILWADSSILFLRSIDKIWEEIDRTGVFIAENLTDEYGSAGKWCDDAALPSLGVNRREIMGMTNVIGTIFGFRLDIEKGFQLYKEFLRLSQNGSFRETSKKHRHDQTALAVIASKLFCNIVPHSTLILDLNNTKGRTSSSSTLALINRQKQSKGLAIVVVCHDRLLIPDIKKNYSSKYDVTIFLVGPRQFEKRKDKENNVIVANSLKYHIEDNKKLLTFTVWYAIVYNKLFTDKSHIAILEYDCEPLNGALSQLQNALDDNITSLGFFEDNKYFLTDIKRDSLLSIAKMMSLPTNEVSSSMKWFASSNTCMRRDLLVTFVHLFWPACLDLYKSDPKKIMYYHERMNGLFLSRYDTKAFLHKFIHKEMRSHEKYNKHLLYIFSAIIFIAFFCLYRFS